MLGRDDLEPVPNGSAELFRIETGTVETAVAETELLEPDKDEFSHRRQLVQRLKLRGQSIKAIAAIASGILGESVTARLVREDLEWLALRNRQLYGPAAGVEPAQEIGDAIADFEAMEEAAWTEFHALKQEAAQRRLSPMFVARARQGWIRTAAMMRVLRIKLLHEHGLLTPGASTLTPDWGGVANADAVRAFLRKERLLIDDGGEAETVKPALTDDPPEPDLLEWMDPIDGGRWMDDGGL